MPADICSYLAASFTKVVTDVGRYKIIIVINDTSGADDPTVWGFGVQQE